MNLRIDQEVWYAKVKKKAIVKEFLKNGLIRITYFEPMTDKRQVRDVLKNELRSYKRPLRVKANEHKL